MSSLRPLLLSLAATCTLLTSSACFADFKSVRVHYSNLDLSSKAGRDRLQLRIERSVKYVCDKPRAVTPKERQDKANCLSQASKSAAQEYARIVGTHVQKIPSAN